MLLNNRKTTENYSITILKQYLEHKTVSVTQKLGKNFDFSIPLQDNFENVCLIDQNDVQKQTDT